MYACSVDRELGGILNRLWPSSKYALLSARSPKWVSTGTSKAHISISAAIGETSDGVSAQQNHEVMGINTYNQVGHSQECQLLRGCGSQCTVTQVGCQCQVH